MAPQRTFSIIKPDATERNLTGKVNASHRGRRPAHRRAEAHPHDPRAGRGVLFVHKERPFFGELVDFMISAPVVVQVLEGENAIAKYREVMGATNPANAAEGTIRKLFAKSVGRELRARLRRAGNRRQSRSRSSSPATKSSADPASQLDDC